MCAVRIPTYERSVNLDAAAQTMPRYRADETLAKGITALGNAVSSVGAHLKNKQEQFENFKASQEWSRLNEAYAQALQEEANNYQPGVDEPGTLHNRVMQRIKPLIAGTLEGIPDRLKPWYQERAKTFDDHASTGAAVTESRMDQAYYTKRLDQHAASLKNGLLADPDGFDQALKDMRHEVAGVKNIPQARLQAIMHGYTRGLVESAVKGYRAQGRHEDADAFVDGVVRKLPAAPGASVPGPRSDSGNVIERQGTDASIRTQPIKGELKNQLSYAADKAGVQVEVYSGGQSDKKTDPFGLKRTGSERHDHGNAADVRLFVTDGDGNKRYLSSNNPQDREAMSTFITAARQAGATGIGHGPGYMGGEGIHVGGGTAAVWGAGGKGENAPGWVRQAYDLGAKLPKPDGTAQAVAASKTDPTEGRAQKAFQFFIDKGLSPAQAAGIVGNLKQESYTLNPAEVHDGGKGIGIAGWNGERRAALRQMSGGDEKNFDRQLEFFWQELNSTEKRALNAIKASDNPRDAAVAAQGYFRPGQPQTERRVSLADDMLKSAQASSGAQAQQPTEPPPIRADGSGNIIGGVQVASANTGVSSDAPSLPAATPGSIAVPTMADGANASPGPEQTVAKNEWDYYADGLKAGTASDRNKMAAKDTVMKARLKDVMASDVASIQWKGKSAVLPDELQQYFKSPAELTHGLISSKLGEGAAIQWEQQRQDARMINGVIDGMDTLPNDVLLQRLQTVTPQGGEPNFVQKQKIYETVVGVVKDVIGGRVNDPAAAADNLPEVKAALERARSNPADMEAAKALTQARLRGMEQLGIPQMYRTPITRAEAAQVAAVITDRSNPNQVAAANAAAQRIVAIVGGDKDMARRALQTVLQEKGISDQRAADVAGALTRAGMQPPRAGDPAEAAKAGEGKPNPAEAGNMWFPWKPTQGQPWGRKPDPQQKQWPVNDDGAFVPGSPNNIMPDVNDIKGLRNGGMNAVDFNAKYGVGAAEWVLKEAGPLAGATGKAPDIYDSIDVPAYKPNVPDPTPIVPQDDETSQEPFIPGAL